jgi:integrase
VWHDGKQIRRCVYGTTRGEVAKKLARVSRQVADGQPVTPERLTVKDFLVDWLAASAKPRLRPRTYTGYERAIRRHLIPGLGQTKLGRLTPSIIQAWLQKEIDNGTTPHVAAYCRIVLRTALSDAVRLELVGRNAAKLVRGPKTTRREITPLNTEQARALLKAVKSTREEGLFTAATALGLRMGELLGLRWQDIDLAGKQLHVRQQAQRFGGDADLRRELQAQRKALLTRLKASTDAQERKTIHAELVTLRPKIRAEQTTIQFTEPKSRRSRRTITAPLVVIEAFKAHQIRQLEERLKAGPAWEASGLVFVTPIGTPMEARQVTRLLRDVLTKAALPLVRMHDLRHSCATLLLAQGVNPRVVMETLGHSQISLTLDTYSHVLPALQADAADRMDAALASS